MIRVDPEAGGSDLQQGGSIHDIARHASRRMVRDVTGSGWHDHGANVLRFGGEPEQVGVDDPEGAGR